MPKKTYQKKLKDKINAEQFNIHDYLIGKIYEKNNLVAQNVEFFGFIFKDSPGYSGTFYLKGTKLIVEDGNWIVERNNQIELMTPSYFENDYEEVI